MADKIVEIRRTKWQIYDRLSGKYMTNKDYSKILLTDLISLHEASLEYGLSHGHLALLVRRGELKGWKIGSSWVTTRGAIQDYLALNKRPGPKKTS